MTELKYNVLKPECAKKLYKYQIERLNRIYWEFIEMNEREKLHENTQINHGYPQSAS